MCEQSRRSLIKNSFALGAGAYVALKSSSLFGAADAAQEPHFYLQLMMPGGVNASCLFDARPLSMTAEKIIVNYRGKDGILHQGLNGTSCLRTEVVESIMPYRNSFSVINGIMMSSSFDGHEENESYFMSGQPLGGTLLFDDITSLRNAPINVVRLGSLLLSDARNSCDGMLKLTDTVGYALTEAIKRSGDRSFAPTTLDRLSRRLQARSSDKGSRAASKEKMRSTLGLIPEMRDRFAQLTFPDPASAPTPGGDPTAISRPASNDVKTILSLFKGGLTNTALYVFDGSPIDTHDEQSAQALGGVLTGNYQEIAAIFKILAETPFDDHRSMLDVTTILIGSEFSRTMRQANGNFDKAGTDHNPFTNTVIIGGKGIKGGMVVGASDFATVDEYKAGGSGAHKGLDRRLVSIMGRPFDFATQAPSMELPTTFNPLHYLNIGSVINTVYDTIGVPNDKWRAPSRGAAKDPILSVLRK